MIRNTLLILALMVIVGGALPFQAVAATDDSPWAPLLNAAFEQNDLEMAVLVLVNDNDIPVSDIIQKARAEGFGYTRIVGALIETKLSCEQVMVDALRSNVPPAALFDSGKIRDEYDYTPEKILKFLVKNLRFMKITDETLGEKEANQKVRDENMELILRVCQSLMDQEDFSPFDVMFHLCQAEASNVLIATTADHFGIPIATALKACPKHAEYGRAYISRDLPQKAYIIIGVDHQTLDDNTGRGANVISPMRP